MKYYNLNEIKKFNAQYNLIFGQRSNGKTFACLEEVVTNYYENHKQGALIRRWDEDFRGKRGQSMFNNLVSAGKIVEITRGMWTDVYYFSGRWYLCRYEDENRITDETPFCYGFSLSAQEHDKSTSYPDVTTIIFDEIITRTTYLPDEFVLFMNVLSTIIRDRTDVTIYMLGNTINKYCPYFNELGLNHVRDMEQGAIDLYQYGEEGKLKVAVEYCKFHGKSKTSELYFNFDNPKLKMITTGAWEVDIYPHLPVKYTPEEIVFVFFIYFDREMLQCNVVISRAGKIPTPFIYIHRKTTEIKHIDSDIVFSPEHSHLQNWHRYINKPMDKVSNKIVELFKRDKVFYASNDVGEIVRNYLMWCGENTKR